MRGSHTTGLLLLTMVVLIVLAQPGTGTAATPVGKKIVDDSAVPTRPPSTTLVATRTDATRFAPARTPRFLPDTFRLPEARQVQVSQFEQALPNGSPKALAAADFDRDGTADLAVGYSLDSGGGVVVYRGNMDAIYSNSIRAQQRRAVDLFTAEPFESASAVFELPVAPDYLFTGDFNNDGRRDVAAAAYGGRQLLLLPGDGLGGLLEVHKIVLPGQIVAMTSGEVNRRDGLVDLVVAINGGEGPELLVFHHPSGALGGDPERLPLGASATSLALGHLDDDWMYDIAVGSTQGLTIVHGRDRKLEIPPAYRGTLDPAMHSFSLGSAVQGIVVGEFILGESRRQELGLLLADGTVQIMGRPGRRSAKAAFGSPGNSWTVLRADRLVSSSFETGSTGGRQLLMAARVTGMPLQDLVVLDPVGERLQVVAGEIRATFDSADSSLGSTISADGFGEVIAAIPMRLNRDAVTDLVLVTRDGTVPLYLASTALAVLTVDATGNNGDPTPGDGTCGSFLSGCTLRAAIEEANALPGADVIEFDIPGGGAQIIAPSGPDLPTIDEALTIDGTTQPGFAGTPLIVLDGSSAASTGLVPLAGPTTIRGLNVRGFTADGIVVIADGNVIEGNFVGTDETGTAADPNGGAGIVIFQGVGNTVGGSVPLGFQGASSGNLSSGNTNDGLLIQGTLDFPASDNTIDGNYLGTDISGMLDLGNARTGVIILDNSNDNIIGTPTGAQEGGPLFSNLASGTSCLFGLAAAAFGEPVTGNLFQGNLVGLDVTGMAGLGASGSGFIIQDAPGNTLGGTAAGAGNTSSANVQNGIYLNNASETNVWGNRIGTDPGGTLGFGNGIGNGVDAFFDGLANQDGSDSTIGGDAPGAGNLISDNFDNGVVFFADAFIPVGNFLQGNIIGTDISGMIDLGNGNNGVLIVDSQSTTVGGNTGFAGGGGAGNLISGNAGFGAAIASTLVAVGVTKVGECGCAPSSTGVGFAPDDTLYMSAGSAGELNVVNVTDGSIISTLAITGGSIDNMLAFDADGTLYTGKRGGGMFTLKTLNTTTGALTDLGSNAIGSLSALAFHPVSGELYAVDGAGGNLASLHRLNKTDGSVIETIGSTGIAHVTAIAFDPITTTLVGVSNDTTPDLDQVLITIDIGTGEGLQLLELNTQIPDISYNSAAELFGWGQYTGADGDPDIVQDLVSITAVLGFTGNNILSGNNFGLDGSGVPDFAAAIPNDAGGILVSDALANTIGGTQLGDGNTISGNGGPGVLIDDGIPLPTLANYVLGNSIYGNAGLEIDLNDDGVTANDATDPDAGSNLQQNFPIVTRADVGLSDTVVEGTINSTPDTTLRLEFFAASICDDSGNGGGEQFLGATEVTTDGSGDAAYALIANEAATVGGPVTATATDLALSGTSEFSACLSASACTLTSFGQELLGQDPDTLAWSMAADVRFVSGPLNQVSTYTTSDEGTSVGATSLDISLDNPTAGEGLYYLTRSLGCGSWQTVVGDEPGRDMTLP